MITPETMNKRFYEAVKKDLCVSKAKEARRVKKLMAKKLSMGTHYLHAKSMSDYYVRLGVIQPGDCVLDVGCRHGLIALPIIEMGCIYSGIEVSMPCIKRSRYLFDGVREVEFLHVNVRSNRYDNPGGGLDEYQVKFPYRDGHANAIIAKSLFTHFETIDGVRRYLSEMHRCLVAGGRLYVTFFLSPPNETCRNVARRVFSQEEVVRSLSCFETLLEFDGTTLDYNDQWKVVLRKV